MMKSVPHGLLVVKGMTGDQMRFVLAPSILSANFSIFYAVIAKIKELKITHNSESQQVYI
jgi:hypothetical protein